jgi:hypothetical protein
MIADEQHFEVALREAGSLLATPPAEDSPEHERLVGLLHDIACFRPTIMATCDQQSARLVRHLKDFETRITPQYGPHWHGLVGP